MSTIGTKIMRRSTNQVLDALLLGVQENLAGGGNLSVDALKDMIDGLKNSPDLEGHYSRGFEDVSRQLEREATDRRRQNCFGRLMIHPLTDLFDKGVLDRGILPNIFTFLHLVLGQDAESYNNQCREMVARLKKEDPESNIWDRFYRADEIRIIQWETLVRIAQSFKRWELRRDWFIRLMQYNPSTVSLGSAAFVINQAAQVQEIRKPFGKREFCNFFCAFYTPMTELDVEGEQLFTRHFGLNPHQMIGQFLLNLATCEA